MSSPAGVEKGEMEEGENRVRERRRERAGVKKLWKKTKKKKKEEGCWVFKIGPNDRSFVAQKKTKLTC